MAEDYETETETETGVEQQFSVWKRNTPLLYDLVISHPLQWPSLTVHFLPSPPQPHSHPSLNLHKLLLGTHTAQGEPNYLMLAEASIPANISQPIIADDPEDPIIPKVFFFFFISYMFFFACFSFLGTNCLMEFLNNVSCWIL